MFRLPLKRFTPFVTAGAGALVFDPKDFQGADSRDSCCFRLRRRAISTSRVTYSCGPSIEASSTTRPRITSPAWMAAIASRIAPSRRLVLGTVSNPQGTGLLGWRVRAYPTPASLPLLQ